MNDLIIPPQSPCPLRCPNRSAICHSAGVCRAWDAYQIDYAKYMKSREVNVARMQAIFGYKHSVSKRCERLARKRPAGNW